MASTFTPSSRLACSLELSACPGGARRREGCRRREVKGWARGARGRGAGGTRDARWARGAVGKGARLRGGRGCEVGLAPCRRCAVRGSAAWGRGAAGRAAARLCKLGQRGCGGARRLEAEDGDGEEHARRTCRHFHLFIAHARHRGDGGRDGSQHRAAREGKGSGWARRMTHGRGLRARRHGPSRGARETALRAGVRMDGHEQPHA
jgi:hypothetical protein